MIKKVIFNADDFGASTGINRGILQAHVHGVVTSASLMTAGAAADEAAALARDHPELAIGLHWDVWGEDEREFDLADPAAVRSELERQLERFFRLMGRPPTHIDSHKHAHLVDTAKPIVCELAEPLRIPVRGVGPVDYIGGFYAQWEWQVTELRYVSVEFLQRLLSTEITAEWTEIGCHPGFHCDDFQSSYDREREVEIQTLTDLRVRDTIRSLGLHLASFADFPKRDEQRQTS